jgi:hypothetical protein
VQRSLPALSGLPVRPRAFGVFIDMFGDIAAGLVSASTAAFIQFAF